jgi:hypothetical protein
VSWRSPLSGEGAYYFAMPKNIGGGNTPLYGTLIGVFLLFFASWVFRQF